MPGVIMHTRQTFDEDRDPWQGPQIRAEPLGSCSPSQLTLQTLNPLRIKSWLATSPTCASQFVDPAPLPLFVPPANTLAADAQLSSDGGQDQFTSCKQAGRLLAPFLQCCEIPPWTNSIRHAHIIRAAGTLVTLLCEVQ
jgi:hypothetical protein